MNEATKPDDFSDVPSALQGDAQTAENKAATSADSIAAQIAAKGYYSTFSGDKQAVFRLTARARGPQCKKADDVKDRSVKIKHIYAHMVELINDQTGEVVDNVRIVVVEPDDTCIAFVSAGILDSLQMVIDTFGHGPYEQPVEMKVVESKTRRGRKVLSLIPV